MQVVEVRAPVDPVSWNPKSSALMTELPKAKAHEFSGDQNLLDIHLHFLYKTLLLVIFNFYS